MDPDETLARLRALLASDKDDPVEDPVLLEVAVLFEALDEWLTKGGFLPQAWQRP